jgi:hypothetical protein
VIARDAFRDQPTLTGELVRLEPLGPAVLDGYVRLLADPEGRRMTGTHEEFPLESIERWLASRAAQYDRADWAAHDVRSGEFVGEKCGFVLEGRRRHALLWEGERYDALGMAVLRSDSRP